MNHWLHSGYILDQPVPHTDGPKVQVCNYLSFFVVDLLFASGLETKSKNHFWTFVSEFPSHHRNLPPNTEAEFVLSLRNSKFSLRVSITPDLQTRSEASEAIANNPNNPFSEDQIEQLIARYNELIGGYHSRFNAFSHAESHRTAIAGI